MYSERPNDTVEDARPVSRFRRILPQVLAGTAKNFLLTGIGASISYATIITPALLGGKESISMTDKQSSWFGSICFICQPIGSLLSGVIMDPIGRKKAMMVVNVPHIIAWILLWNAQDLTTLFIANALLGLGTGLMEAPIITYIGEICEPSVRGVLVSYSSVFSSSGIFGVYLLGTVLDWRTSAAVCLAIPLTTILVVSLVPESPIWLISKGRNDEAIKSLCWLRGWVKPSHVRQEFDDLHKYNENNFRCRICGESNASYMPKTHCTHKEQSRWSRIMASLKEICRKETLRPLILSSMFFLFSLTTSFASIKPNMVNVFKAFNMTLDPQWATVGVGLLSIMGALLCMVLVKCCGKRPLVLACMIGSFLSTFLLALYAYYNIPHNTSSYAPMKVTGVASTTPLVLFIIMVLCNTTGLIPISWVLVSEIFPYRTRGNACGIVAAISYLINFVVTKTYIDIESSLHIYGAFYLFAAVTFVGIAFVYFALPETENRNHEEIESDFAHENMKIFANDFITNRIKSAINNKHKTKAKESNNEDDIEINHYVHAIQRNDKYDNEGFISSILDISENEDRYRKAA